MFLLQSFPSGGACTITENRKAIPPLSFIVSLHLHFGLNRGDDTLFKEKTKSSNTVHILYMGESL